MCVQVFADAFLIACLASSFLRMPVPHGRGRCSVVGCRQMQKICGASARAECAKRRTGTLASSSASESRRRLARFSSATSSDRLPVQCFRRCLSRAASGLTYCSGHLTMLQGRLHRRGESGNSTGSSDGHEVVCIQVIMNAFKIPRAASRSCWRSKAASAGYYSVLVSLVSLQLS